MTWISEVQCDPAPPDRRPRGFQFLEPVDWTPSDRPATATATFSGTHRTLAGTLPAALLGRSLAERGTLAINFCDLLDEQAPERPHASRPFPIAAPPAAPRTAIDTRPAGVRILTIKPADDSVMAFAREVGADSVLPLLSLLASSEYGGVGPIALTLLDDPEGEETSLVATIPVREPGLSARRDRFLDAWIERVPTEVRRRIIIDTEVVDG